MRIGIDYCVSFIQEVQIKGETGKNGHVRIGKRKFLELHGY